MHAVDKALKTMAGKGNVIKAKNIEGKEGKLRSGKCEHGRMKKDCPEC